MAISRDGGEWGDVPREHHLSIGSSFDSYHLCAAPGGPSVSCCDGGGGRAARRRFGGYGFCNALHERLAAVCGDLVRASNRSHGHRWPAGRAICAALVAGSWPALPPESLIGSEIEPIIGKNRLNDLLAV